MKKIGVLVGVVLAVALAFCLFSKSSKADQPAQSKPMNCQAEMVKRNQAQQQVNGCMSGWTKNFRPEDPMPKDDCGAKLKAFVAAAKDAKKCNATLSKQMGQQH